MKKHILILALFLTSFGLSASHLAGGEIYWECQGNGDYVFTLIIYRDCNGIILNNSVVMSSTTPAGNITLTRISTEDITWGCANPVQSLNCANVQSSPGTVGGVLQKHIYKSAPVTIGSTAPPAGYQLWYETSARTAGIRNLSGLGTATFHVSASMYPAASGGCIANSPRFLTEVQPMITGESTMSFMAGTGSAEDSLHYNLVTPKVGVNQLVSWSTGYSAAAPLPDPSENSSNGPVTFDNERGILGYDIASAQDGNYVLAVKVDMWRNGNLYSSVVRDIYTYYTSQAPANEPPYANIDTALFNKVTKLNVSNFVVNAVVGDTIDIDLYAFDGDMHPSGVPQNVQLRAYGDALDTIFNQNAPLFASAASITPNAPQSSFTHPIQSDVNFKWIITPDMIVSAKSQYYFTFEFRDDSCPYPLASQLSLKVVINNPAHIGVDTVNLCEGGSVQLSSSTISGSYVWSPNTNISDNTIANPVVSPATSMYYYLTDPQNPSIKDSVYVQVEPLGNIQLTDQSGILEIGGTANLSLFMWYYNGMPFYHPHDTLTPFAAGDYWVTGISNVCVYTSDTVTVSSGTNLVSIDPSNGTVINSPQQITGSLGLNFNLDNTAAGYLQSIYMLGVSTGTFKQQANELTLKLYETATQTEIFSDTRTINNPNGYVIEIPINERLMAGVGYTLALSGDSTVFIQTFQNVMYPFEPYNNGLVLTDAMEGAANQLPINPSGDHLAVVLNMDNTIALAEKRGHSLEIYPNPASETVIISGPELENVKVEILDLSGKMQAVKSAQNNDKILLDVSILKPGVYIVRCSGPAGVNHLKVVIE